MNTTYEINIKNNRELLPVILFLAGFANYLPKFSKSNKKGRVYMQNLFGFMILGSILLFIVGMVKPSLVIRWGAEDKRDRKKVAITYLGLMVFSFLAFGAISPSTEKTGVAKQEVKATQAQAQPQQKAPAVKKYKSGQYKVGVDLPAGEYVAIAKGDAYIEVASDSSGAMTSIVANDIFANRSIITVSNGQYLKIQNCELYAFNDAPKTQTTKDGFLLSGMYKVGVDLPAGEYKVISEGGDSYIETSRSSRHSLQDIISNDLFQGNKYVSVSNGQYVKFFRAKIQVNK